MTIYTVIWILTVSVTSTGELLSAAPFAEAADCAEAGLYLINSVLQATVDLDIKCITAEIIEGVLI